MLSARACNAQHASDAASRAAMRERFQRTVKLFFPIRVASARAADTVGWAKSLSVSSPRGQTRHAILPTRDDRISRLCPPYDCCDAPRHEPIVAFAGEDGQTLKANRPRNVTGPAQISSKR